MRLPIIIAASALLVACSSIPLKTLYKLATTDPLSVDPAQVRSAVRIPTAYQPQVDGVTLTFGMEVKGKDAEKLVLMLKAAPEEKPPTIAPKAGYTLHTYHIAPDDIARLNQFRTRFKAQKARSPRDTKGSMALGVKACRASDLPLGAVVVSAWLRLDTASGYLPVIMDYDLRKSIKKEKLDELIPRC